MIPALYPCFKHWDNQTIWIYSDTHFGDKDLQIGFPQRPNDEEHVAKINAAVGCKDTLILLGDVGDLEYAKKLRGYKVLILGNHDSGKQNYMNVFDEVYAGPVVISDKVILSHEPIKLPYLYNIHGHVHEQDNDDEIFEHFNVCADVNNYQPSNLTALYKVGMCRKIESIHRITIDRATKRKENR